MPTKTKTLEQMSDAELDAMLAQAEPSPYDNMSDAELDAQLAQAEGGSFDMPETLNEMHPDFTVSDRAIVKNLGTNIDDSIAYLKKQHPGLDIKQESGEIVARRPGEAVYKKLDPDSWSSMLSPSELAMDAGDIGYDVASGIGATAATAAGGALGNIPGAMAAGGTASAGLEGLRQYLGKALGVNKEVSGTDVALAGGFGAAAPLLFGSGVATKDAAKAAANQGLISRGAGKLGELTSGVREDVINFAGEHLPKFKLGSLKVAGKEPGLENLDEAIRGFAAEGRGQIEQVLEKSRLGVGKAIEETVDQIPTPIDLAPARLAFDSEIGRVSAQMLENPTEVLQQQLDFLIKQKQGILGEAQAVSGRSAWEIQKSLEQLGKTAKTSDNLADKRLSRTVFTGAKALKDQLDAASGGTLSTLNKQAQDNYKLIKELKPFLKSDQSFINKLSSIQGPKQRAEYEMIKNVDAVYGTNILEKSKLLTAHKHFSKAPWLAISADGVTATARAVPASLIGGTLGAYAGANSGTGQGGAIAGGALGMGLGAFLGGPKAIRAYMQTARNAKFLEDQARNLSGGLPVGRAAAYGVWNAMTKGGEK